MQPVVGEKVITPHTHPKAAPEVSVAIFAWNEEHAIRSTLNSLFQQSIFGHLGRRHTRSEVFCVTNGCTDQTPVVAAQTAEQLQLQHPDREAFTARVANIVERGKVNAWNQFVHHLSAPEARVLFMMDADILIDAPDTMWNMITTLERDHEATVVVDLPRKDLAGKNRKSMGDLLSLAASQMTLAAEGQLCGQLYCIRADAARKIFLPKDLAACEDGFIKTLVCTDFLTKVSQPRRIRLAKNAGHTFGAYTSPATVLKNQKRQVIGQTIIHLLVDHYFKTLSPADKHNLAGFLESKDSTDPSWLKRLIHEHVERTQFSWQLYPDLLSNRFRRLRRLDKLQRLRCFPAALAGCCATAAASFLAYRTLKRGCTDYWPKASRSDLKRFGGLKPGSEHLGAPVR